MLGTDAGAVPYHPFGYTGHRELEIYVRLGMTPMQAIQSATSVAAESLGWVGDTGAVAPGYYADIIAVDGDPLEDISVMENVTFVMKGGEVYKSQ